MTPRLPLGAARSVLRSALTRPTWLGVPDLFAVRYSVLSRASSMFEDVRAALPDLSGSPPATSSEEEPGGQPPDPVVAPDSSPPPAPPAGDPPPDSSAPRAEDPDEGSPR